MDFIFMYSFRFWSVQYWI